jgi:hypothetical protein
MTLRSAVGHEHARFTNAPRSLRELGAVTVEFLACSVYNQVAGRSTCSGGHHSSHRRKSTIWYLTLRC